MTPEELQKQLEQATGLLNESTRGKISWLQHLLLICSTVLGLIAGLHTTSSDSLFVRWAFVAVVVLLALGILSGSLTLYSYQVSSLEKLRRIHHEKLQAAIRSGGQVGHAYAPLRKWHKFCERVCYVSCLLSVIALVAYTLTSII